jgi:hypothetical protein
MSCSLLFFSAGKFIRRGWEDNIKMDLREIGWGGMDWIDMAQHGDQWRALVNTVVNSRLYKILGNS